MASRQAWRNRIGGALLTSVVFSQSAVAVPVLSISSTPAPAVVGSTVAVNVLISGITDLFAYQYSLNFNPLLLQASTVTEGTFLASGGTTYFSAGSINNTAGSITLGFNTLIGDVVGVSGAGTLARVSFNVLRAGTSTISFTDLIMIDSALAEMSIQVSNGTVQAIPEPATLLLMCAGIGTLLAWRRKSAA